LEHELAGRRRGVDALLIEIHAPTSQPLRRGSRGPTAPPSIVSLNAGTRGEAETFRHRLQSTLLPGQ
jgi:hypothetical protein